MRITTTDGVEVSPNPIATPALTAGRLVLRHPFPGRSKIVRKLSPGVEVDVTAPGPTDEVMRRWYGMRGR